MQVRFSLLARDQLRDIPETPRRDLLYAVRRQLTIFPESGPELADEDYLGFRQLTRSGYRLIYRYDEERDEVQVYCILHVRRRLPSAEFLRYRDF